MGKTQKLRNKKINVSRDDMERLGVFWSLMFFFSSSFFLSLTVLFFILGFFVLSSGFLFRPQGVFSSLMFFLGPCEILVNLGRILVRLG